MNLLIDTHILVWWDIRSPDLRPDICECVASPENPVFVSAASVWEIATKRRSGKLQFGRSIRSIIQQCGFAELPISVEDAELAGDLDWDHHDPFDRLLVAQARNHDLTLVTADRAIRGYGAVAQIWAG